MRALFLGAPGVCVYMAVPVYAVVFSALATLMTVVFVLTNEPAFDGRSVESLESTGATHITPATMRSLFRQRRTHLMPQQAP